ncbi:MAG: S8 family peptidase [Candidatus Kaiserbacteria bacterium]|nr:S8 family peptidase [Candidatus Kaiserbacteria bacterium]
MTGFPHLELAKKIDGLHKPKQGGPREIDPTTQGYLNNREGHGGTLLRNIDSISQYWRNNIVARTVADLPALPNPAVVPVFLRVDAKRFDIESLKSFGIEVIAEEENGFIIGASSDDFNSLRQKITKFMATEGKFKDKASQLWQINEGEQWRVDQILSDDLKAKWASIEDDEELIVDVGIACYVRTSGQPVKTKKETAEKFRERMASWKERKNNQELKRDEIAIKRQTDFETFVSAYQGELVGSYIDFDDSFSCRIKISGKGLKDIVMNYQYVFEVVEHDSLVLQDASVSEGTEVDPELIAPTANSPRVCVIDSGIQEAHRLLAPAIDNRRSASFIPSDASTADVAANGGHGTKVAGAVLYPQQIPREGQYLLPCFIENARVLARSGTRSVLPENLYPPKLMEDIVTHFVGTRIFNMSINSYNACKLIHMSQWAAAIDKLMHTHNILFIISTGNLNSSTNNTLKPGIKEHLDANRNYPNFLLENSSRIGNPAQSCFALTVGSVCLEKFDDALKESFGSKDQPSSFSRTGLGLWGMIKPDVVEYGGDFVKEKVANPNISHEPSVSPELVRSTYGGGSEIGKDDVGTSFAAPRVSHIAAILQKIYPEESANLYRTLIVQSARLPASIFSNPSENDIRHYGYGIPSLQRATQNSESRITLIASGDLSAKQANVYSIKIPSQMRRPGEDYDILVEVTLSFTARPRRTRRGTHSYLSTWLSWESSKLNEAYEQFVPRVLKDMDEPETEVEDRDTIKWVIRENKDWSEIEGIRRQDSTLQKSWCTIKSNRLPEALSLAVIGHSGWEGDLSEKAPYSVAVSFEALSATNINVYEMVRIENEIELPVEVEQEIIA